MGYKYKVGGFGSRIQSHILEIISMIVKKIIVRERLGSI